MLYFIIIIIINTSLKLISHELASITILHILKYKCRLTNTNELCVGSDVTSICRMLYICIYIYFDIEMGPVPLAPEVMPIWSLSPHLCLFYKYRSYGHFNDFVKSRRPYRIFLIEKGPSPTSTFGCADSHTVQIYVSITNTEGVIAILMLS